MQDFIRFIREILCSNTLVFGSSMVTKVTLVKTIHSTRHNDTAANNALYRTMLAMDRIQMDAFDWSVRFRKFIRADLRTFHSNLFPLLVPVFSTYLLHFQMHLVNRIRYLYMSNYPEYHNIYVTS